MDALEPKKPTGKEKKELAGALEPKKLALLRILEIFQKHSDYDHPLTQEDIAAHLAKDYGIVIERKAIGRNISLLREAGYEIESGRSGSYLDARTFEDSELRMLIDGVLCSRYITAKHSKDLIERLCGMSSMYFRSHVKSIYSVNEWSKTDNQALFYNIELIDDAIEQKKQIRFDYNKYGADKKLHRTTTHRASPYQLILHNQRYYLMAFHERWKNLMFYRLDRITNMTITEDTATPIDQMEGYEHGIDYSQLATALPYMFTDKPEMIEMLVDAGIIDQIIDWFGTGVTLEKCKEDKDRVCVRLKASVSAMEFWAMQYLNHVEVLRPQRLREKIRENLLRGAEKYTEGKCEQ